MNIEALKALVRKYNGTFKELRAQALGLQTVPGLENGYCLALAILSISRKDGTQLIGPSKLTLLNKYLALQKEQRVSGSELTKHCCKIMTQQRATSQDSRDINAIYERFIGWIKTLARDYDLTYEDHETADGDKITGLNSGTIAGIVLKTRGRYIIGMSGTVSHAISVYQAGSDKVLIFEPNYGAIFMPKEKFTDFFMMFCYKMHQSRAYKYSKAIVVRFAI